MKKDKFKEMILWMISNERLPKKGEFHFCQYHNVCKGYRGGFGYRWHDYYDEVLDAYNVDSVIFEKRVWRNWLELLEWVLVHGRKPRQSNVSEDETEYRLGGLWARISRAKWGRCGNKWDVWYEEKIVEYGLSEILIL